MSAPRILAPTTISGGIPTAGAGTLNTVALWTPDGFTLGNSLLTQAGSVITNATGAIRANGTTQSTPAFMRYDATTSGIYFPATNEIGFTISSQHAMFISTGRNVGIGTTSPDTNLSILRTSGGLFPSSGTTPTNAALRLKASAANAMFAGVDTASPFGAWIQVADTTNLSLTYPLLLNPNGGNVGIGTASPAARLHATFADSTVGTLFSGATKAVRFVATSTQMSIDGIDNTGLAGFQQLQINGLPLLLATSGTERARIDSSGNFGVGETSPSSYGRLAVTGSAVGAGILGFNTDATRCDVQSYNKPLAINRAGNNTLMNEGGGNVGIGTASPNAKLEIASTSSGGAQFRLSNAFGLTNWWEIGRDNATTGALIFTSNSGERMRIAPATSQVAIGTTSFTSGCAITTVADLDVYGVRVGRGAGAQTTNTAVGASALNANTTGIYNTAVGNFAGNAVTTGANNTSIGFQANALLQGGSRNTAVGESAGYAILSGTDNTAVGRYAAVYNTGSSNVAIGSAALNGTLGSSSGGSNVAIGYQAATTLTTGAGNTALGVNSGSTITTGSNNILLGANAITVAATDSNKLVIGSSGNYVATNGGATTWYTTATAQSTGVLPATCGFIRVLLNGTYVKIPVYAD